NQYSVLNHNQQTNVFMIDAYDFTTLEKVETLFDSSLHQEIKEISNYFLNKTDDKLLIATNYEPIYRRSFTSVYYLYDIATKKLYKTQQTERKTISLMVLPIGYMRKNLLLFEHSIGILMAPIWLI